VWGIETKTMGFLHINIKKYANLMTSKIMALEIWSFAHPRF
jgi:hypothetical protein